MDPAPGQATSLRASSRPHNGATRRSQLHSLCSQFTSPAAGIRFLFSSAGTGVRHNAPPPSVVHQAVSRHV
ncbi:hypothetical protein NDU88_000722 [Pleurodeles waltl]|uniref:Uncharacterized protein n=1 Tax=Pleurodeles waltl TaxID=8319 RepID=A0AAV7SAB6_PLEWA|nr:hypothetical protein NDU88_000722 [Pleurodeles waltl]